MVDYMPANFSDRLADPPPEWERKLLEFAGKTEFGPLLRCILHRNDTLRFPVHFKSKFLVWDGGLWGARHNDAWALVPAAPVYIGPWGKITDGFNKMADILKFEQWEAEAFIGAIAAHVVHYEDLVSCARTLTGEAPDAQP